MQLQAPAKINLYLRVARLGADGFHPLLSWFCTIGLYDTIEIQPATGWGLTLTCNDPALPVDEGNLLYRAGRKIDLAANVHLIKRIPMGAGLGGGSSDAGTLLKSARQAIAPGRAEKVAESLGADVRFFLDGPSAICSGRGEVIRPIAPPKCRWAMLVLPRIHMPTAAVYRKFDEMKLGSELIEQQWDDWTKLSAQRLLPKLVNDLEPPAFSLEPKLGTLRAEIEQALGQPVRMSGSGSSLFTLFDAEEPASEAARTIAEKFGVVAHAVEVAPRS